MAKSQVQMWDPTEERAALADLKAFATEVAQLKHKAGVLGLLKTMHALEEGVTAVGYEIAELLERRSR